jgi:hypothetical protein
MVPLEDANPSWLEDSGFGRLIGALVSPDKTFRSIAGRPTWGAALVVLLIATTAIGVLVNQRMDRDDMRQSIKERMEKGRGGQASPEDVERGVEMATKVSSITRWLIPLFVAVTYLIIAALFLAAFRFFGGSSIPYRTSFSVALHAFLPGGVAALITLPLILNRKSITMKEAQGGGILASNLGAFAPESLGPVARTLLSSVDFFSIWTACLLIIGYRAAAKVSTATAATVVVVIWALYIAFRVGMAALFG